MAKGKCASNGFMTLKVELPPTGIMRTIVVPQHMTLEDLHEAIQAIMGWERDHLWSFSEGRRDGVIYELPHDDGFAGFGRRLKLDASAVTLKKAFPVRGAKLTYEYDFGDSWNHSVTRMADPKTAEIACVKSEGPDGMEDFGGPWRLAQFIEAMRRNPDDDEYADTCEWAGFDSASDVRRYLEGESADLKTKKLKAALSHVRPVDPAAVAPEPLSEKEKVRLLGLAFATVASSEIWSLLESAMRQGGSCAFDDPDKEVAPFLLTAFDGLKVKDGGGSEFSPKPDMLTVPQEWTALYARYGEEWNRMRGEFDALESYACAAVNLYGVLSMEELLSLILRYDKSCFLSQDKLAGILELKAKCPSMPFRMDGDRIVSTSNYPLSREDADEAVETLLFVRAKFPRWYPPTREDLFKWEYADYYERTPETEGLEMVLRSLCGLTDTDTLEEVIGSVCGMISAGMSPDVIYKAMTMTELIRKLSCKPRQNLLNAILRVGTKVHAAVFNGNAACDLQGLNEATEITDKPKISRNAPCPCGSGKKYKMCCGKDKI